MNNKHLVLQTDFGLVDGAVSAMQGVAYTVAPEVTISNLTHEIEPYNINKDASVQIVTNSSIFASQNSLCVCG